MQQQIIWYPLERRFRLIPDRFLRADGSGVVNSKEPWCWYTVNALSPSTRERFRALAKIAGQLLDPFSEDPVTVWLEALRRARINFVSALRNVSIEGDPEGLSRFGTIVNVCEASADFCLILEAESGHKLQIETLLVPPSLTAKSTTNNETADPSTPKSIARKLFVEPILMEKGWSLLDWANYSEVDFHTVNGYLKGKTNPQASTLKKLANSLGVKVKDLPK